jgi:uncharacterized protein DUF5681
MTANRQGNGRFGPGNRANPNGRPRKATSANATVLKELIAPVTVTENQKRRKISKLAANAKQIANKGASGDLRAAKMAVDLALRAESQQAPAQPLQALGTRDQEIVARFIERLRATLIEETGDDTAQP